MHNSFHVPLVDNHHNSLSWAFINFLEKILIPLINKNSLEFWEENIGGLDEPVNLVWI